MDFYTQVGKVALGSRLRRLSETLTEDAAQIFALYQVGLDPKWFPVFYMLWQQETASVTELAQIIGHSHASVSQLVKEMRQQGLLVAERSASDARVSVVRLSEQGRQFIPQLEQQLVDVGEAVEDLLAATQHNLWKAVAEVEYLLAEKSLLERVRQARKVREQQQIEIIDYSAEFHEDFRRLNYAWIEQYFQLEPSDQESLDHPDTKILQPGGHIYLARRDQAIVGTCALIKLDDNRYELAKMTVAATARGNGIGWLLGQAAIHKARELGAKMIYLESNTILEPAIKLYQKLGFQKIVGPPSPYERCNIQMQLRLDA
jgi:DNA-binding MarR family transcriptional regulator/predicted GNAT family N-acyltransferase